MRKILTLSFALCLGLSTILQAQEKTVTGRVLSSEDNLGIPGASIIVKGTTLGTTTDFEGGYSIKVPSSNSVLVFSFVGMKTTELVVGDQSVIDITLNPEMIGLEEIVITGLGAATDRRRVAISVETVNEDKLTRVPSSSIDGALIGRVAGANIQSTSGQPGQQANIILRGINTLGSTQPMILVDGVEINAGSNLTIGSATVATVASGNVSSRLADIDLSNIERVEVIQGAAAATIYGAQGANGVIQIFTKKGRKGQKTNVNFSSNLSIDNPLRGNLEFAKFHYYPTDSEGYILDQTGSQRIAVNPVTGQWATPTLSITAGTLNNKPFKEQTFDHLNQYFLRNVPTYNNSLNLSGGLENVDYSMTISNLNQTSPVYGDYKRTNLNLNLGADVIKGFSVRSSTQLIASTNTTGGINGRNSVFSGMSNALNAPAYVDHRQKDADGKSPKIYDPTTNAVSPFYTYENRTSEGKVNRIIQGFNLNYKPFSFAEVDYRFGVDHYRFDWFDMIRNQESALSIGAGLDPLNGRIINRATQETTMNSLFSVFLRFDLEKDFGLNLPFPVNTVTHIAYDWRNNDFGTIQAQGTGLTLEPPHILSTAADHELLEHITKFTTFGYLINHRFDFGMWGGVSLGYRADYSSAFGEGSKPFGFPRVDGYIRLSEFIDSENIYELKLRAAYGEAGIQPNAYDRLITLSTLAIGNQSALYLPDIARNPLLGVEKSKESEIGVDYVILRDNSESFGKFSGSAVLWGRMSEGSIFDIQTAPSQGSTEITTNAINLKSNGIQLSLDIDVLSKANFAWTFGTRFGKSITTVDKISNGQPIIVGQAGNGQTVLMEGQPVGAFFGYRYLTSLDQKNAAGEYFIDPSVVDNFEIVNGMVVNKTTRAVQFNNEEQFKIGDATPDFSFSFFNDFTLFKDLMVSMQIDWIHGAQAYNQTKQWLFRDRLHSDFDKEVTINGETGAWVSYWASIYNTNRPGNYFVEDASYLRLRNVSVSYDLAKIFKIPGQTKIMASIAAHNLFTLTNYSGMDPEAVGTNLNDPMYRGIDLWSFPNTRSVQFGLNINF
jgi:TonB-dependent starch-binding outer membrane protein SusC